MQAKNSGRVIAVTILLLASLGACSIKPSLLQQAMQASPSLAAVQKAPDEHNQKQIVWGGSIIKVDNNANDTSRIWVLAKPLARNAIPMASDHTTGRFVADLEQFLDPEIYRRGRRITIVGNASSNLTESIGDKPYHYPVVSVTSHRLWPRYRRVRYIHLHDPFFDPFARHNCLHRQMTRHPEQWRNPIHRRALRRYCDNR